MSPRTYTMTARAEAQEATANRILDAAYAAFIDEPYERVTLAGIAEAAGVSHQTVLNHFGSKEGLFSAFGDRLFEEIKEVRGRAVPGDPRSVVAAVLEQYERFGDANARWDLLEERFADISAAMREARGYHRAWLEEHFAPWLDLPRAERERRLALLYVATDVKTWKLLRRHLDLGRRATGELMLRLVQAAVSDPDNFEGDGR